MMLVSVCLLAISLPWTTAQNWTSLPGSITLGNYISTTWPQSDIGQPLQPQSPDAETQAMIAAIDTQRIENIVTTLSNFGTRHTLSNQTDPVRGIGAARDWIYNEMLSIAKAANSSATVEIQSYTQGVAERISFPVKISNVVATIKGSSDPNRTYVVTGHYDSRRIDIMDYTGDAPGADDDATGVAGTISLSPSLY